MSWYLKTEYVNDEIEYDEQVNELLSYGLYENLTMCNCYGVEEVYAEMWGDEE